MPSTLNMKTEHAADKAQGEWTTDMVAMMDVQEIADAHNATLAAEREKVQPLMDALTDFIQWSLDEHKLPPHLLIDKARAALAGNQEFWDACKAGYEAEIAAERENAKDDYEAAIRLSRENQQLNKQLAKAFQNGVDSMCTEVATGQADQQPNPTTGKCTHDLAERETACADGMCPICANAALAAEHAALEHANTKWIDCQKQLAAAQSALGRATDATGISFDAGTDALDQVIAAALAAERDEWIVANRDLSIRVLSLQNQLATLAAALQPLVDAGQEALLALATLKITDTEKPYAEISPTLRQQILKAHDLLVDALAKVKEGK